MKFNVTVEQEGKKETRVMEAPSRFAIYGEVEKEGARVVAVERAAGPFLPAWLSITIGTGVKQAEIVTMTKNLSAMLSAGLTLSRSLSVIERQSGNKRLKKIAADVAEEVKQGAAFHEALAKHPRVFSKLFVSMAQAGEESGGLADALAVVGLQMERSQALTAKVRGAMIYPSIVLTAIVIVGVLMLIFVVPTLTKTFISLGVAIPLSTQIIVAVSDFMVNNVILVIALLIALAVGGAAFVRSKTGSTAVLWAALHLPVVGELVRETFAARAARTMASLLASGVVVLRALQITEDVVGAPIFASVVAEAEARVRKGDPISAAFVEHPKLYPILFSDMIAVGEETGKVSEMMKQVAEFYEADVEQKTKDLSTIIEPVLMLFIGLFVGIFAVSMIAPIYSLSSSI
ncbi:MAG: type II secretion system F family protein [Patescibacteria group bacterium]|nr:type II secretion system F family protein [Patescibacteria group bacterium]MDE1965908.1 type II secretion system F family protein [Patescibacteria group bacterium]